MRIIKEEAERMTPGGMEVLHAEIAVDTEKKGMLYVQAHDNGMHRYYAVCTQSWFALQQSGDEEEDPLEEYTTSGEDAPEEETRMEPDFSLLLKEETRRDAPYEDSEYVDYFVKADRLLDDLAEE